jgi:hypothetical protein
VRQTKFTKKKETNYGTKGVGFNIITKRLTSIPIVLDFKYSKYGVGFKTNFFLS